jgi:anti-sigma-K factor RskA
MSQDTAHTRYADWDGAYVLGVLSPAERREYEKHLEQCELCRAAVAELASMPGLLARLDAQRAQGLLDDPLLDGYPNSALEGTPQAGPSRQLLDLVRLDDRRRSHRRVRVTVAVAAAAAVIAAAIAVPLVVAGLATPAPQTFALEEVADVPLSASVKLIPVEWGTRLELDCSYADATDGGAGSAWSYGLYVTGDDGTTNELSTWKITPGSEARISAGTELDLADIHTVEIRPIGSDTVLLRATVED